MEAHPHKSIFLTASSDKTVKVWSLGIGSGLIENPMIFKGHKNPVFDVSFLGSDSDSDPSPFSSTHAASCDYDICVWDVETGQSLTYIPHIITKDISAFSTAFSSTPSPQDGAAMCFKYISSRSSLVIGTSQATLKFVDVRTGHLSRPWRHLGTQQIYPVRTLGVNSSSHWIASGSMGGEITLFDERTGMILSNWRAHEGAVIKCLAYGDHYLVSSGSDKVISVWDIRGSESVLCQKFSPVAEPVRYIWINDSDIMCPVGNKMATGTLIKPSNKSHKLQSTKFSIVPLKNYKSRSHVTCFSFFPQHRMMLAGTEEGRLLVAS